MTWTPADTNVSYPSGSVTATATERCNVFVPSGTAPAAGWPVLLWIEETALDAGSLQTTIAAGQNIGHQCLARGIAFVSATVARASDGHFFDVPGSTRWNNAANRSAWKSAIHLIQWAKGYAGLDPANVAIGGEQIGADLALWAGAGPDWPAIGGAAQFRAGVSHRARAVVAMRPTAWFMAVQITQPGLGFHESGDPTAAAVELGDANQTDLEAASPMHALLLESSYPGIRALTAAQRLFLWAPGARGSDTFTLDGTTLLPTLTNTLPTRSDPWGAQVLRRATMGLPSGGWQFHVRSSQAIQQTRYVDAGSLPSEIIADASEVYDRAAEFVAGAVGYAPPIDPVQERILRNFAAMLRTPAPGSTYFGSVHQVFRAPAVMAKDAGLNSPAVYVSVVGVTGSQRGTDATNKLNRIMRVEVDAFLSMHAADATTRMERLAYDIETAIYADRTIGGLATETMLTGTSVSIAENGNVPLYGTTLSFEIEYRVLSTDLLTHT